MEDFNLTKNNLPFISAFIVMLNERNYIEPSLMSFVNQTYPKDRYEIIVIDGGSTDGTLEIVYKIKKEYSTESFQIRVIDNPKRILASGWNLGIKAAKGEYVTRIDAHAEAASNFIEKSVETILNVDAACVGGKLDSIPLEGDNLLVSKVLSSPFGVGNSSFRVSDAASYADTAVYGLYRKSVFNEVGYFDEQMVRNQDIDLHSRIRKAGYKFYFNPEIKSVYHTRSSVKKMVKQAYGNGKWNMVLLKKGSGALSIRHLVPLAFVIFLIVTIIGGIWWHWLWWLALGVMCLHLAMGILFSIKKTKRLGEIIIMPWLFIALHLSYGVGYLSALFKRT